MKYKIGISGNIGSGKTIVSRIFEIFEIPVYNSDYEASKIINSNKFIIDKLKSRFGENIYNKGVLNKLRMREILFGSKEDREFINKTVHPVVIEDFLAFANQKSTHVAIESALIFDSQLKDNLDVIVSVISPSELRAERISLRDNISNDEALKKMLTQHDDSVFMKNSDYIIINDEKKSLFLQVESILKEIYS